MFRLAEADRAGDLVVREMRRAAKRDAVEADIIEALKVRGWSVLQVSVKDGPDLFAAKQVRVYGREGVASWMRTVAIEVKTGKKKLRPGQEAFRRNWAGEYVVLRSAEDAIAL